MTPADDLAKIEQYMTEALQRHNLEVKEFLEYDARQGCFVGRVEAIDGQIYGFILSPNSSKVLEDAPLEELFQQLPKPKGFNIFSRRSKK